MKRIFLSCLILAVSPLLAQTGAKNGEWPTYGGDLGNTRYSALDQINAANFDKLEVAWRFKTDNLGPRPEANLEGTPLMVKGILYSTAGTRRSVVALDAATGELLWVHGENEGQRGTVAPRQLSGRGLAYWTDGREERIIYVTPGYQMVALDAKTGNRVPGFGKNGLVDLKEEDDQQIDPAQPGYRIAFGAAGLGKYRNRGRGSQARRRPGQQNQREGLRSGLRRPYRQAAVDLPHHPQTGRVRTQYLGTGFLVLYRQHRAPGDKCRSTSNLAWPTSASSCRPATTMAALVPARACSAKVSSRWI